MESNDSSFQDFEWLEPGRKLVSVFGGFVLLHDLDFSKSPEIPDHFEPTETFSKIVRPYASITSNCVDIALDDSVVILNDPINIRKDLSPPVHPVDIAKAD